MDFDVDIEIRDTMVNWGPWTFDFENGMPSGVTVSAVTATVYEGRIKDSDEIATATEITSVVDAATLSSDYIVAVRMSHPGTYEGNATLVFSITGNNGGVYPFIAYRLRFL
jgi:hypothetical protein